MKTSIILGLGYGDEGKGLTTDYLCRQSDRPLVIRFSGGHQAGHTVVTPDGIRHVFSNFGAGTLNDAPTYWSKYCSFNPIAFWNEWQALQQVGFQPKLFVDALAKVTTPFDIFHNQSKEKKQKHGSCGVGFGATMARNQTPYKLYVQDLLYPQVLRQRLQAIGQYYAQLSGKKYLADELKEELDLFLRLSDELAPTLSIVTESNFVKRFNKYDHLIFEGSQGILLDMDHGFFPHVTYANTTSKNAIQILGDHQLLDPKQSQIYYITRAYQTRHGNGFLSNEGLPVGYEPNPEETNQYNEWQGTQRVSPLDLNLLNYAMDCDRNYSGDWQKNLVVTCLDQLRAPIAATIDGELRKYTSSSQLLSEIRQPIRNLLESHSACGAKMTICNQQIPNEHQFIATANSAIFS